MSLTVREQQALEGLANRLARSDPGLAARLTIFTRLTWGEAMPSRESTGPSQSARLARGGTRLTRGAHRPYRRLGLQGVVALLWLAITVALIAVAVAVTGAAKSNGACTTSWPVACAVRSAPSPR